MALPGGYLLDTNILVHLIRGDSLGVYLDATYGFRSWNSTYAVSAVVVGEILALSLKLKWGQPLLSSMHNLLAMPYVFDVNQPDILLAYADIDAACDRAGRSMGKNDVWIAATAHVTNTTLLTTDRDFDFIHGTWIDREWVDPASKLTP